MQAGFTICVQAPQPGQEGEMIVCGLILMTRELKKEFQGEDYKKTDADNDIY